MKQLIQSASLVLCFALAACSSDPATFITYTQRRTAAAGKFNATEDPRPTDALALNYANSVEEIFRSRSTGARYTREASDTALVGLSAFAGAAESLSIGASTLSGMGLAGVGILELRKIFDARARSNAFFEAADRIHGAIKDFRAYNLNNISDTMLSPNGWTLANVVQANIDIVSKILNGHLPSPEALAQASERMSAAGATPQRTGSTPVNNIPAGALGILKAPTEQREKVPIVVRAGSLTDAGLNIMGALGGQVRAMRKSGDGKRASGILEQRGITSGESEAVEVLAVELVGIDTDSQARKWKAAFDAVPAASEDGGRKTGEAFGKKESGVSRDDIPPPPPGGNPSSLEKSLGVERPVVPPRPPGSK